MADTWGRYFGGRPLTPGEIQAEKDRRREIDAGLTASGNWRRADPQAKMALLQSARMLDPVPTKAPAEFWDDVGHGAGTALRGAIALLDTLGRGRDAAFRAVQEVNGPIIDVIEGPDGPGVTKYNRNYNFGAALGHLASIPSNMVAPVTGAPVVGGYGEPDDWRQYTSPGGGLFIDIVTDPLNFVPIPVGTARKGLSAAGAMGRRGASAMNDAGGTAIRNLIQASR